MKPLKKSQGFLGRGSDPPRAPPPLYFAHRRSARATWSGDAWTPVVKASPCTSVGPCHPLATRGRQTPDGLCACLAVVTCGRCGDDATSSRSSDDVRWGKVRVTSEGSRWGDGGGVAAVMGFMGWMGWMIDGWMDWGSASSSLGSTSFLTVNASSPPPWTGPDRTGPLWLGRTVEPFGRFKVCSSIAHFCVNLLTWNENKNETIAHGDDETLVTGAH